jgi:hypothetical protein
VAKDCLGQKLLADSKEKEKANKLGGEKTMIVKDILMMKKS